MVSVIDVKLRSLSASEKALIIVDFPEPSTPEKVRTLAFNYLLLNNLVAATINGDTAIRIKPLILKCLRSE